MAYAKKVIALKETKTLKIYKQHETSIQIIKTYKRFIITGSSDNTIKVRHLDTHDLKTFPVQIDSIKLFDISSDGKLLMILAKEQYVLDSCTGKVTTTYKKDIHIHSLASKTSESEIIIENVNDNNVIFAGEYIISSNNQGHLTIWSIHTCKIIREYKTWHKEAILSLFYDSKEDILITGSKDGMLNALDLKSFIEIKVENTLLNKSSDNYKIWIRDIQNFNNEDLTFYATKSQSKIILWKFNQDQCIEPVQYLKPPYTDSRFYSMAIHPSGKKVVVGGSFGLGIWDLESTYSIAIRTTDIMDIKFLTHDHFITCHRDGKASIWTEMDSTYKKLQELDISDTTINYAAVINDSKLALATHDGKLIEIKHNFH